MAEPVVEHCVAAIASAVALIKEVNGYMTTLNRVLRFNRDPYNESTSAYACVVKERNRPLRKALPNKTIEEARIAVYVYLTLPSASTDPDKLLSRAAADVRKAVQEQIIPGESEYFDRIDWAGTEQLTRMDDQRPVGGVRIDWDAQYLTTTTDPYTGRS